MFETPVKVLLLSALMIAPMPSLASETAPTLSVGAPCPTFYRRDVNKRDVDLKRWQTKKAESGPLVITFFASWCKACKESAPLMTETVRKFRKSHRLKLVAIGVGETKAAVREYMAEHFGTGPDKPEKSVYALSDKRRSLAKKFGAIDASGNAGLPLTYIVDRKGTIRAVLKDKTIEQLDAAVQGVLNTP